MVRIPFNRRIWLFMFVIALAGLQVFIKIGIWYLIGTVGFLGAVAVFFALTVKKQSPRPAPQPSYRPFLSVLIPAHNEETVIAETVQQAFKLRYHNKGKRHYEVWVIDDRSSDGTLSVLKELKKKYPELNILSRDHDAFPGKSEALNDCLPLTRGEILAVFDADAHFPPDIVQKAMGYLAPDDVGGAQVAKRIANPETNWLCQRQSDEYKIDTGVQKGRDEVGGAVEFKGNGSFIKRKALENVGGWTKYTITEDLDLSTKMLLAGYHVRFVPETCVWEQAAPDTSSFVRQRLRWIEGSMMRYLIHMPRIIKGPLHPRQRFDMFAFLVEFALPLFVLFEVVITGVFWITSGHLTLWHLSATGFLLLAAVVFLMFQLVSTFIREERHSFMMIIGRSLATMAYMLAWFPHVIAATFNLIVGMEARSWKKVRRIESDQLINH